MMDALSNLGTFPSFGTNPRLEAEQIFNPAHMSDINRAED